MKLTIPRIKAEHAVAQRLWFEKHGNWGYDPGEPNHQPYLLMARRVLKAVRDCERAVAATNQQQAPGGDA